MRSDDFLNRGPQLLEEGRVVGLLEWGQGAIDPGAHLGHAVIPIEWAGGGMEAT